MKYRLRENRNISFIGKVKETLNSVVKSGEQKYFPRLLTYA